MPCLVRADVIVIEGEEARKLYNAEKYSKIILLQKNKVFTLRIGSSNTIMPKTTTVKVNERFFIVNGEERVVHNVYDISDGSWVLRKQKPGGIAAISFDTPGEHKLRCAIHPKMQITVKVE